MKSGNPALRYANFEETRDYSGAPMTWKGTLNKSFLLLIIASGVGAGVWLIFPPLVEHQPATLSSHPDFTILFPLMLASLVATLGLSIIIIFIPKSVKILSPIYAACEGLFIGVITVLLETAFPGIAFQAIAGTIGVFLTMLVTYRYQWIDVTHKFANFVITATFGICMIYLASILARYLGHPIPYIHESGPIGIGFSLFVVAIAAFNLLLDFEEISDGIRLGAPKEDEWYAAFSLLVTIIWLYLEILRLLRKIRS
jgi:uncharacterized YccA/Bax inhibitor family protein